MPWPPPRGCYTRTGNIATTGGGGRGTAARQPFPGRTALLQDPVSQRQHLVQRLVSEVLAALPIDHRAPDLVGMVEPGQRVAEFGEHVGRSEEHTSELQSLMRISYAVFCLKKKKQKYTNYS